MLRSERSNVKSFYTFGVNHYPPLLQWFACVAGCVPPPAPKVSRLEVVAQTTFIQPLSLDHLPRISHIRCSLLRTHQSGRPSLMTIHRIRLLGDPILRAKCEPIPRPGSTAVA